jgi:prepilin-type N-terminal cleavage/methylation domain-containing protein
MRSRGFTLVEVLIAIAVMSVLATALTRILLSDSRFVSRQEALLTARQTARAAMNVMSVELRMVSDSGLLARAARGIER